MNIKIIFCLLFINPKMTYGFYKNSLNMFINNFKKNNNCLSIVRYKHTAPKISLSKDSYNIPKIEYKPKTPNQKIYKKSLYNQYLDLVFCNGPAGSGKTMFACQYAIQALDKNKFNKIIITRPTITIEENIGFLPGNIKDKMHPFTIPIFDIFKEYYTKKELDILINENIIEISPLGFMQGRTFKNAIIIADEMQNSSPNQMFMLLTRLGTDSKMIVTGDLMQTNIEHNGLNDIMTKLNNRYNDKKEMNDDGMDIINLENIDIQRSAIVANIEKLYRK